MTGVGIAFGDGLINFCQNDKIRFREHDGVLLYRHSGKPEGIIRNPIRNNGRAKRGLLMTGFPPSRE
jgi:hypothetical protein